MGDNEKERAERGERAERAGVDATEDLSETEQRSLLAELEALLGVECEASPEMLRLAEEALERMKRAEPEDISVWSARIAADLMRAAEKDEE